VAAAVLHSTPNYASDGIQLINSTDFIVIAIAIAIVIVAFTAAV
jgi:hypothetical protein